VTEPTITKATAADAGCWLEGSRGWYATPMLIRIAWERGMPHDGDDVEIVDAYEHGGPIELRFDSGKPHTWQTGRFTGNTTCSVCGLLPLDDDDVATTCTVKVDVPEAVVDMADDAENWLNDNVAPEGYAFGWHDGEFFLWTDADWEVTQ